ncbi:hypothetical protein K8R66_00095 [bacterium]|nr:hypothetical protein [bacterium]
MAEKFSNLGKNIDEEVIDKLEEKKWLAKIFGEKEDELSEDNKKKLEEWKKSVKGKSLAEIEEMGENLKKEIEKLAEEE